MQKGQLGRCGCYGGVDIVGSAEVRAPSNRSVNADAQSRSAAAPRRSLVAGYVQRYVAMGTPRFDVRGVAVILWE